MQVFVNGSPQQLEAEASVAKLLDTLKLAPVRVAVELNEVLVPRKNFAATPLHEGDQLEIVTFVGGG